MSFPCYQSKNSVARSHSRSGIVLIDMLIGLVILAAFLSVAVLLTLQIEEIKLESLRRNDECAWAMLQKQAAVNGLRSYTDAQLLGENVAGVTSQADAPLRVDSSSALLQSHTIGNLVITPRLWSYSGNLGNCKAIGYILQDCGNAGFPAPIFDRELPVSPDFTVTFNGDVSQAIPNGGSHSIDLLSGDVSWSGDDLIFNFTLAQDALPVGYTSTLWFRQVGAAGYAPVTDSLPFDYTVDVSLAKDMGSGLYGIPFEALVRAVSATGDVAQAVWSGYIVYNRITPTLVQTRILTDRNTVTLADVSPSLGISGAVNANGMKVVVTGPSGELLPAAFFNDSYFTDTINGITVVGKTYDAANGAISFNAPVAAFNASGSAQPWVTTVTKNNPLLAGVTVSRSLVVSASTLPTPAFTPPGGDYDGSAVTISNASALPLVSGVADAAYCHYCYTDDGSTVMETSTLYQAPFSLNIDSGDSLTLRARAFRNSVSTQVFLLDGSASAATYTTDTVNADFQWGNLSSPNHPSVLTGGYWEVPANWDPVPGSSSALTDTDHVGLSFLLGRHLRNDVTVTLSWRLSDRFLSELHFNNDLYRYTLVDGNWQGFDFYDPDGTAGFWVESSPKTSTGLDKPHVFECLIHLYSELELFIEEGASLEYKALRVDQMDGGSYGIHKRGPGSAYWTSDDNGSQTPLYVHEGNLILGKDDPFPQTTVYLDGGTLNVNKHNRTSWAQGIVVQSHSVIDMGSQLNPYIGSSDAFSFQMNYLDLNDGVHLIIKNWIPGSDYESTGGSSKLITTTKPSDDDLKRIDFEGWEAVDPGYDGGARVVLINNWLYHIIPAAPRYSKGIGYLQVNQTSTIDFASGSSLEVEGITISSGANLILYDWDDSTSVLHSVEMLDSSSLSRIIIRARTWNWFWGWRYLDYYAVQDADGTIRQGGRR
ncbi:MAG: hypothetical protein JW739_07400 [Opitutales bacterium]|nr:hypothetical protein [Opitutales bacterium]